MSNKYSLADLLDELSEEQGLACYSDDVICEQCGVDRNELIRHLKSENRFIILGKQAKPGTIQILPKRPYLSMVLDISLKALDRGIRTVNSQRFFSYVSEIVETPLSKQDENILVNHACRYALAAFSSEDEIAFPAVTLLSQISDELVEMFTREVVGLFNINPTKKEFERIIVKEIESFFDLFISNRRNLEILLLRSGMKDGKKYILEEIGSSYNLTRERVRQIEKSFDKKLNYYRRRVDFMEKAFLYILMKHGGKRIYSEKDGKDLYRLKFIGKLYDIPLSKMVDYELYFLGIDNELVEYIEELHGHPDCIDEEYAFEMIGSIEGLFLSFKEKEYLSGLISTKVRKSIRWEDLIYIAMGIIGRPAHYTEVAQVCKELIPEKDVTPRLVLAVLSRDPEEQKRDGVWVWTGARGIYALREWGYSRPSLSIFDTVYEIVNNIYGQTGKPVSLNTVYAEIGKYRQVINRNSVNIACYCNQNLIVVDKDRFIPGERELQQDDDDGSDMDTALRGLDHLID